MDSHQVPAGAMIAQDGRAYAVRASDALPWTSTGYGPAEARPHGPVDVLTPPLTCVALRTGYSPLWHPTADDSPAVG